MASSRPTRRTQKKDDRFFAALSAGKTVTDSAKAAGYKRCTVHQWRNEYPDFAKRWEEALDCQIEVFEKEADRRALKGTTKPVFHKGQQCGQVREYSDTLLMFRLKKLSPSYRDHVTNTIQGPDNGPVQLQTVDSLTDDRLRQLETIIEEMHGAGG